MTDRHPSNTIVGYLFAAAVVMTTFALGLWLIPMPGSGGPLALFFAALLVISLMGVVYMTFLMQKGHQAAHDSNQQLREANDEITKSMARTREAIELAADAFFQADLNARLTDVNQAACRMLGYDRDELIGKTIVDIIPPEDVPRLAATREYLLSPDTIHVAEWTQLRKDGTSIPVEVSSKILPDGRWQAFARDISERKRIERTLQESEERFRLTFDEAPIGMAMVALDGRFIRVNRALCEIVGYSSAELTGLSFYAITHPDDLDADRAAARQFVGAEIPRYQRDKRYVSKDGTIVDVMISASVIHDRDGTPLYFISQIEDIRERKRAERALKESEQRLNLALDSAQVGMWDLDLLADTSVRSLRHDQIFGYPSPAPAWGTAIFMTHVVPEDRDDAKRAFEIAMATGNFDMECRIQWADTSIHWISAKGRAYRNVTGDPVRMMGTIMDITERKHVEEELKAANASLDAIIDNIPLMLFIKESTSLRFHRLNRAAEDLLGWPQETLIGKSAYDMWPPEQAAFFVAKDRETLNSGTIVDIPEEPIQTPHQGVRILHTKKVPILDAAGNPLYLLGISEDITDRSRIEKNQQFLAEASIVLSASLDYEQTVASLAGLVVQRVADWCGVDVVDEHGQLRRIKVASADPAGAPLCRLLEQMPPDRGLPHVMRSVIESKQPLLNEHVTPEYMESIAQGREDLQGFLATGVTSLIVVPLLLRGQALGAMALGSSTPSRVYGQDDLRLAEALADRAAIAIENARLYRASVEAAQLRDQVLGVVAHDLRNPLSAILLMAGALKRLDPEAAETIRSAGTRMDRLIQDLLDVALMESSQLTIEHARVSTRELIFAAVEMQRPLASSSSLELRADVDSDVADVWGDRDRLLQVFQNLIGNAIKFTDAGGRITVSAASTDHEVVFQLADTGCGIAPEDLPRVFDRFWQATRDAYQGAGLGLPITKGIVETHGGRIWVESIEGRGTTFSFTIPTVASVRLPEQPSRLQLEPEGAPRKALRPSMSDRE